MAETEKTRYDAGLDTSAATVEALARALELHDYRRGSFGETAAHASRVTQLGLALTELVAPELALEPQLAYGFRLHDIGMIGVSNTTLVKPGPLSPPRSTRSASIPGSVSASSRLYRRSAAPPAR